MSSAADKLIRLLIIDEGLHEAEVITSSLRTSGLQVLAEHAEDEEDLLEIIDSKPIDLVLCSMDLAHLTLQQVSQLIQQCGRHLGVIGMALEVNQSMQVDAMNAGAQDVVRKDYLQHLALVIQREFDNLRMWRDAANNEKELQESEKRCQSLLANSKDAVAYCHEGMHIFANQPYLELFGQTDFEDLEGVPLIDMVDPSQQDTLKQFLRQLSQQQNPGNELTLKMVHQSGEVIEGVLEFSRASFDGEPCTQIVIRSKADTSELEEQINYLHQHDLVTGLFNRQYFTEMLKKYLSDAISDGQPSVLLFISIDNFQQVRDTVGISGCDILINDIAGILQQNAINQELVCRFGAYSYAVLCKGKDRDAVEDNSARLLKMVEENISEIGNHSISATCSIGIYYIDENAPNSHNEIIARVERTLDQVQHRGGNRAQEYVPVAGEMTQEENDGEISRLVRSAVTSNTVKVYFQPIVCISGSGRECYEISRALVNREQQELAEADFIEAANRSGTAKALDRWTIAHAISLLQQAIMVDRNLDLVIRLSQDSLTDPELTRWIAERIQSVKVPGSPLVFAISESDAVSQLRAAKAVFKGLKQLHCKVILDEFGTGLNPFQLVKHLPADYLRINPAFVSGLTQNEENQQSIRSINEQAAEMDIQCIVPNVTDAGILTQLWSVGAAFVQGDFLQPPSDEMNYDFSSMAG